MNIQPGTIIRTFCLAIALANQVLSATGHPIIDISDDTVSTLITTLFTVAAALAAWWKNNSFTKAALYADQVLKDRKTAN